MNQVAETTVRLGAVALLVAASLIAAPNRADAAPGLSDGNYMWFKPGSTAINGSLGMYHNFTFLMAQVTAGSGNGVNWNNPCISNQGRLPNGWYNTAHEHHINNKDTLIKGRVWGLTDKACAQGGTIRTELYIHTEETKTNGQQCGTGQPDHPYCWEGPNDYHSAGCVKVSHPSGVSAVHSWWHSSSIGGGHGVAYTAILWVGTGPPPL